MVFLIKITILLPVEGRHRNSQYLRAQNIFIYADPIQIERKSSAMTERRMRTDDDVPDDNNIFDNDIFR